MIVSAFSATAQEATASSAQTVSVGSDSLVSSKSSDFGLRSEILKKLSTPTQNLASIPQSYVSALLSYKPTPGDIYALTVSVFANSTLSAETLYFQLDSDHCFDLPILGKTSVKGMDLFTLQKTVTDKLKTVLPVTTADFRLMTPALFDVFVYGGVMAPGKQRMNSTFSLIDAIAMAGGLRPTGSYRQIIIRKPDGSSKKYDISKYFTDADFDSNPLLSPNDTVQILGADIIVSTNEFLNYGGSYELIEGETIADVMQLGGGIKSDVECNSAAVVRQIKATTQTFQVPVSEFSSFVLKNNDIINFIPNSAIYDPVIVDGAIFGNSLGSTVQSVQSLSLSEVSNMSLITKPQRMTIPYSEGLSVLSALDLSGGPTPMALLENAFILKKGSLNKTPCNIKALWQTRNLDLDIKLNPGDRLVIPMEQLVVFVGGEVNNPNAVQYNTAYSVFDYVKLAGGYTVQADMRRFYTLNENGKRVEIPKDYIVSPGDIIYIEKNFAQLSNQAFKDVLVYTGFVSSLVATASSIMSLAINVRNWQRN